MNSRARFFGLACALQLLAAPGAVFAKPADAGRDIAIGACGGCHQVTSGQKRPAPVHEGEEGAWTEAPTFMEIANRCLSADELRNRITNPHYPMREQLLTPVDVDELAAYIRSVGTRAGCPIR
jgi:mono/diheme cytochrome c family protein